ncbi:MAG: DUF3575 domain-containing protein [Bacteroidales bacterium]|nr:DUF3575 domain-containing protein [Bacteroidales bacterium]
MNGQVQNSFRLPDEEQAAHAALQQLISGHGLPASVDIRSAASPEGPVKDNEKRSAARGEDARQLIQGWIPGLPDSRIHVNAVGEDYETLRVLLRDSDIPGAREAMHVIETVPVWVVEGGRIVSSRKQQLMHIRGGETWNRMREDLYPLLRQTRIDIRFGETETLQESEVEIQMKRSDAPVLIYFPFDDATLRPSYRSNLQSLSRLDSLFKDNLPAPGDTILIVGKASMDGPELYNASLAKRRAEAIRRYITDHFPAYAGIVSLRADGESWQDLRAAVTADKELSEETRRQALGIIDSDVPADSKEASLKAVPGWRRFSRSLYPTFRSTSVTPESSLWQIPALSESELARAGQALELPEPITVELRPDSYSVPELSRQRALRPVLGISTNLLYDITYIPNYGLTSIPSVSLEYYPARTKHFTYGLDVEWPMWMHWDRRDFLQIQNITLWTRRYFRTREERFRGLYLLGSLNGARFGVGTNGSGWEGEGLGASVGIGHKWILGRSRFFFDAGIAAGVFYAQYDPYVYGHDATDRYYYDYAGDPDQFQMRNHRFFWAGPTRIYFSFGIDLFNRHPKRTKR